MGHSPTMIAKKAKASRCFKVLCCQWSLTNDDSEKSKNMLLCCQWSLTNDDSQKSKNKLLCWQWSVTNDDSSAHHHSPEVASAAACARLCAPPQARAALRRCAASGPPTHLRKVSICSMFCSYSMLLAVIAMSHHNDKWWILALRLLHLLLPSSSLPLLLQQN